MLCPVFIGRNSGGWRPRLRRYQCPSLHNSWKNWLALIRATVPVFSGPSFGNLHSQILCIRPEEVHQFLCSDGQAASQQLSVPDQRMDVVPVCHLPGWISTALFNKSISQPSVPCISKRASQTPGQLSLFTAVIQGIKRTQGSPEAQRLPITNDILMLIFRSLDLSIPDHRMFWSASNLAYFGFLSSAEFTVPNFPPALHLSVQDISVDSDTNPSCLRVRIKVYKTDPFHKGCFIHIGRESFPLCTLQVVMAYLAVRGSSSGPLFLYKDGRPLFRVILIARIREFLASAGVSGNFSSHSFRIGAASGSL